MYDYEKDGAEIYRRSFATIRAEADLTGLPDDVARAVVRMIHACGQVDLVEEHLRDRRGVQAPQLPGARSALGDAQARVDVRRLEVARVGEQDQDRLQLARSCEQLAE